MGSVSKRLRTNIRARRAAVAARIVPPVLKGSDGTRIFLFHVPLITYRTTFARIIRGHKKLVSHQVRKVQKAAAKTSKREQFYQRNFFRRMYDNVFGRRGGDR